MLFLQDVYIFFVFLFIKLFDFLFKNFFVTAYKMNEMDLNVDSAIGQSEHT